MGDSVWRTARHRLRGLGLLAALAVAVAVSGARSAAAATVTWTTATGHGWNTGGNWSGGMVPGPGDDVVVDGAVSNSRLDIDTDVDVKSITIQGAYTRNIVPTGSQTIRVRGNVSLGSAITLRMSTVTTQIDGDVTVTAGTFRGNGGATTISGSVNHSAGAINGDAGTLAVTGNLNVSGTADFTASSTTTTVGGDATFSSTATSSLNGGNVSITGSFSLSNGIINGATGTFTVGTAMVPRSVTVSTGGTFNGAGAVTIYGDLGLSGTGTFRGSSTSNSITGNVSHDSSGTLNLNNGNTGITGSFSQSAGSTTNLGGTFSVGVVMVPKNLTVSGGTLLGGAGVFTLTGDVITSGAGDLRISSTSTTVGGNVTQGSSGTLNLNGGNVNIGGYLNQTGGTVSAGTGAVTVTGNLIEGGGTFTAGSGAITIGGDLSVTSGAFNGSSGTIKIAGNLGPLSAGTCRLSSGVTWLDGTFNRTSTSNTFDGNGGALLFRAASNRSHTLNGAALSKVIFNDSLAGYWRLEEASGPYVDSSGYANDGTLNGSYTAAATRPPVAFADTAAITLDGASNYISLGTTNLPAAGAAQTISAWVNFAGAASTQSIVAMTASGSAIKLGLGGGNLRVLRNDGTALVQVAAPSTGAWHHVAYVYDPSLAGVNRDKLYVDGAVTTGTNSAHDAAVPTAAYLGATAAGTDLYAGSLDEVRIYTRALGAREMTDLAFGRMPATGVVTHTLDGLDTSSGSNVGAFVLASGMVAGSGALTIEGDWLNYGGRYIGSGSVTLNGGATTRVLLSGGYVFTDLTINSGGKYTMADRLWVTGTLNIAGQSASFNDGGYVFRAGTFTTASGTGYQVSTGTAVIDGRANGSITAQNFNRLRLEAPNETGLAGYWKLDEGQETTTRDASGGGNTGTLSSTGATWAAASSTITFDNAAAASFDGSSGVVSAGATGLPAANAAQTVSAWVKFSSAAATQTLIAMTGSGSAIKLGLGGGNVRALRNDGTVLAQVSAPSAGAWHHVAYVHDPTASGVNKDKLYVDGTATTGTNTAHDSGSPTATFLGASSASADFFSGQLDDVRVYTQALTADQVTSLNLGRYAGTGISTTLTLGANVSVALSGVGVFIDSGVLYTSSRTVTVSATATPMAVYSGTLHIGSNVVNPDGGLTVYPMGTLRMDESGGQLQPGVNSIVAIDGTLIASNTGALIQRDGSGQRFSFRVGTTPGARPTLNISGLAVRDTDIDGMRINYDTSAVTTFTRFDNISFLRGVPGAGAQFLQIYGTSLFLTSKGCSFGIGQTAVQIPEFAVKLTGNGVADGETRVTFGGATCATTKTDGTTSLCVSNWKSDDDSDGDGTGNTPASNGAVVQFIRGAGTDTAGTIEGFPTAAFDWSTFTYYSTYVTFHDASGTADRVYVRDQSGGAEYHWETPSGETIVGTPKWNTIAGTHYLFVALASGKVYRLVDDGASLTLASGWGANPYDCSCTITTPLGSDANNLYWGGSASGNKVWTLGQTSGSAPMGSPITITPAVTTAAPAVATISGTTYLFLGTAGNILQINAGGQTLAATNTNPGASSVYGRISVSTYGGTNRVMAGDSGGNFWSIDPANFSGTNRQWTYAVSSDSIRSSAYSDSLTGTVQFGTDAGKVVVLNTSTGTARTGYPYTPGTASDSMRTALLYTGGILAVGTTTGKLFFIDRNNGTTGPTLLRTYNFGPTQSVSGIGYDSNASRYMVATSDAAAGDGRVYYIDRITDPTSGSL
jgi:hypothetical protein